MSTLLHIDSSPLGDSSISRHLSAEFVQNWKRANPTGTVITRDLALITPSVITAEWVGASYTPATARTAEQKTLLAQSDLLIDELRTADEYVIGVPMHNLTIPATLRLWIDQVVRFGETFTNTETGPAGLLSGKKATVLIASGGVYSDGSPTASLNFVEPYLRTLLAFIGVTDTKFISVGGTAAITYGKIDRNTFLATHDAAIEASFTHA